MTKILTGITFAIVLLVLGMISPSFAIQEPNKTQNSILSHAVTKNTKLDQQILVADFPSVKGGKAIFHWMPRPQEGINGIQISTQASPELILANIPTSGGNVLKLIPMPQEGIDGLSMPKPISKTNPQLIGDTSVTVSSGSLLKPTLKIQEGIDGISLPKSIDPPMMIVAESPTSKGKIAILHLVPVPAPNPKDSTS